MHPARLTVAAATLTAALLAANLPAAGATPLSLPDRGPVLSEPISRGVLELASATARPPGPKTVDGDTSDWIGASAGVSGNAVWDAGEHIYSDYLFDAHGADDGGDAQRLADFADAFYAHRRTSRLDQLLRTSGSQLGVPEPLGAHDAYGDEQGGLDFADLREVRWAADDSGNLDLLVRLANLRDADASRLGVLVLADTDEGGGGEIGFGTSLHSERFDRALLLGQDLAKARDLGGEALPSAAGVELAISTSGWSNTLEARLPADLLAIDDEFDVAVVSGRLDGEQFVPLNVAYRQMEPLEIHNDRRQALDLHAGTVDRFSSGPLALADLVRGRTQEVGRLGPGYHERHLRSGEGISAEGGTDGIWQPYGIYVPTGLRPGEETPTTFWLHYRGGTAHSGVVITPRLVTQLGEEPTNLMVFPHARGTSEWYVTEAHQDFWEVYADVHQLLPEIDPSRRYLSGYSMGGYGSWLLASLYPDRFAAAFVQSGAITQGAWLGGGPDDEPDPFLDQGWVEANDGDARAQLTYRALESLRHVPFAIDHGTNDELVPVTGIERMAARLTTLGYAHRFTRLLGYEHFSQAVVDEWADGAAYLQAHTSPENPRRVTYAVVPALVWAVNTVDPPTEGVTFGFRPDGAYWVDDVVVRDVRIVDEETGRPDETVKGLVDFTAGPLEAAATLTVPDAGAVSPPDHSTPYLRTGLQHVADPDSTVARSNRFSGRLRNVGSVRLDADRMGLDLAWGEEATFGFELTVDGPTVVRLSDVIGAGRSLVAGEPFEEGGFRIRRVGRDLVITLTQPGSYRYEVTSAGPTLGYTRGERLGSPRP